ncbi:diguanylate cyclase domain-containing protein [Comamonas jiangduensis]|uniref:diguanylate cyclase domain-containing protein n=1 Tax=Comamonas jiangduensis TaxID=1194168 RepID=UPI003BF87D58
MQLPSQTAISHVQQERECMIRGLFHEYIDMYASRDDRLTTRFSQNFTGFTGSWGRLIHDRDEWIRITRQDFEQVPGPIRMEVTDVSLQDLSNEVVSVAATLRIHLPNDADLMAHHVTRLVLVFRLEAGAWMITHCSYSVPFHGTNDDEVYPIRSLQQQNRALQALVAERTRELQESQAFYRLLTEDAEDVHWQMDRDFIVTYISPADERLRGFQAAEVVGRPVFELLTEEAGALVRHAINLSAKKALPAGPTSFRKFEIQQLCKDGSLVWGEVLVKPDLNAKGEVVGYHGITRNVTERKRLEEQVRQLAFHDTLTQLANRRLLLEHLDQAMGESKRSHHYGAVIYLDLDNFKPLNDIHGHGMGDLLLIEVGSRLKGCVRAADTVARIGGDEFVVLLRTLPPQLDEARVQAIAVAEKIRGCLAERYVLRSAPDVPAIEHACTASIGVALFCGRDETLDSLMQRADQAMYQAKENGRNRVQLALTAKK